ncbi:BgTH12-02352 [Blumeria graminis f. sp. triticale]|uniref:BgtA-20989 n=3 Tax=Blumeria graminis TaxID=34373 RepID=A0A9X9MGG3_BLUGR|nr:hypothetical protein BGT96224_A20989 [Blumeria graminis f. sp. tritici 96224]CAD6502111.1 BgTH12-02352 [Blumeria graminis f. sp. triticale]VDB86115.1 BgtA-20989 [Blumeria graminis f. sp. tritici]
MSAPVEQRVHVPIDDPNADTEWNDILRKHGVIPEKPPSPTPFIEEAILESQRLAQEKSLQCKDLDELDELEDLMDESILQEYRKKRIEQLALLRKKSIHGTVYPINKQEYTREVTDASLKTPVLVLLTSANTESRAVMEIWPQIASEYGEVKFCQIRADMAIEGYPDRNCPTIIIYKDGNIVRQVVALTHLGGVKVEKREIENLLREEGIVKDDDLRTSKNQERSEED